jgi:hypothetical protein
MFTYMYTCTYIHTYILIYIIAHIDSSRYVPSTFKEHMKQQFSKVRKVWKKLIAAMKTKPGSLLHICFYVYIYIYIYIYICICTYTYIHTYIYHIYIHIYVYTYKHINTHIHICIHTQEVFRTKGIKSRCSMSYFLYLAVNTIWRNLKY